MEVTKEINLLELFSGIGGFTKGFIDAGYTIKNHWFSEVDKHAVANYKYNFPHAKELGSVLNVGIDKSIGESIVFSSDSNSPAGNIRPDVITFGSPCQDFSLAGKRTGMEGERSVLILEAIRVVTELRPSVFIWENVKGTFSSNNRQDFWAIIQAFTNIGGYRLEWELLNTKRFLPQNRERIYLVGHLAEGSVAGIFPIGETITGINEGTGNSAIVRTITAGGHSGGHHSSMTLVKNLQGKDVANTIRSSGRSSMDKKHNWDVVQIKSATKKGFEEATEGDSVNFSVPNSKTRRGRVGKGVAQTLDTASNQGVIVPSVLIAHVSRTDEAKEIRKESMKNGKDYTPFQGKKIEFKEAEIMNTITCATQKDNLIVPVCVAMRGRNPENPKSRKAGLDTVQMIEPNLNGTTNTLTSVQKDNLIFLSEPTHKHGEERIYTDHAQTVQARYGTGGDNVLYVNNIRRLTEIECERLQGYEDNWTEFGIYDGVTKKISKTQRYKMIGNAVTVAVVKAVAQKIQILKPNK